MTDATVATEVHQALDIHRNLAAQVALDFELIHRRTELGDLGFGEVLDRRRRIDTSRSANLLRARVADTVDRRQCDHDVLVQRDVYASYTCHLIFLNLALALLVPGVFADHAYNTIATNDLAVSANFLNGCSYFHEITPRR
jgi:hypothetical protein